MALRSFAGSTPVQMDASQCFMLSRILVYSDRLLDQYPKIAFHTLEMLHWALGPEILEEDLGLLSKMLDDEEKKLRCPQEIDEEIRKNRNFASVMEQGLRTPRNGELVCVVDLLRGLLNKKLNQLYCPEVSDIQKNLETFQQMFGLSELEKEICLFFLTISIYEETQNLFEYRLKCDRYPGRGYLATILDTTPSDISKSLNGKLSQIGILESGRGGVCLERDFLRFLQNMGDTDIDTEFFKKIDPDPLPLDVHNVEWEVTEHALCLMSPVNDKGNTLLLYGHPGVGKTTFAYGLARKLGLDVYVCKHEGKEKGWQRQAAVMASVNMVTQNPNSLLIIDDCDSILGTAHLWSLFGAYNDKKWLHEVLESNARIIFIVNDIKLLEESVIRRFSFSIHFKPFSRAQRIQLWKNLAQNQKIEEALTDAQISELASTYIVSPGVIEQSLRTASRIAASSDGDLYKRVLLSLRAHEGLLHGGHKLVRRNVLDKDFVLEGLHVSGAELDTLIKDLNAYNEYIKNSGDREAAGMSLLFHGVPGSGKSHLARYIAHHLDREIVVKRASDLLSKWVGETEHNIREAFEEAEAKEAILVFDEADSLVGNRDRAGHSWEISQTNEFLTWMEQFSGIQIFTTNRLSDLDSASLRRFNHKIEFKYLTPEGNVTFYKRLLAPMIPSGMTTDLERQLKSVSKLAPGDFNVVRNKFKFKDAKQLNHQAFVAALREEAELKSIHAGDKAIGF
jgi:SpoVK/Ycf46/Vps4 family AAA+-type ATPase